MAKASAPVVSDESALVEDIEDAAEAQVGSTPLKAGATKPTPKINMPGHKGMKTMKILLEENTDIPPNGQFIGHNGVSYMLKPGIWVEVPLPIIEILNNAVQKVPEIDPNTRQVIGWREKLRYPYRVAPGSVAA